MPHVATDTSAQMAAPLAGRGINDRLVELRPLVDETRFEFIDVSNFGAINFLLQNTPDALPKIRMSRNVLRPLMN